MTGAPVDRGAEVAVVGAGPVGLALALGLARAGRRVVVLEKEASTSDHSRAPAIWPRTQEILDDLGLVERFLGRGIPLRRVRLHDAATGRVLIRLPLEELEEETPYPQLLILPQSTTERLLLKAVGQEPTAEVRFSSQVIGVEQDGAGVRVAFRGGDGTRALEAAFAVGCDGAHSAVRQAIGASFEGVTYGTRAALADVTPVHELDLPFPRLSTRGGLAVAIRIDERLWRLILPFAADDDLPLDERVERAAIRIFPRVVSSASYGTVWQSEFRLHRRVSSRFVEGRIALAGDAAHLNSPVGGQGMNAGLQDAADLTGALLRALDEGGPGPLAAYAGRRRRAIDEGVNPFTDRLTRLLLFRRGRLIRPILILARLTLSLAPLRRRFLRRIAMLDGG